MFCGWLAGWLAIKTQEKIQKTGDILWPTGWENTKQKTPKNW
jgi:hypothetical protein